VIGAAVPVVIATGAIPSPGSVGSTPQGPRHISIDDALYIDASKSVVVFDQNGTNEAAFVAEELAGRKHRVTFVTPFEVMAPYAGYTHRQDLIKAFHDRFVTVFAGASVEDPSDPSDRSVAVVDKYGKLCTRGAALGLIAATRIAAARVCGLSRHDPPATAKSARSLDRLLQRITVGVTVLYQNIEEPGWL